MERKAGRIKDPIARLRYLQLHMAMGAKAAVPKSRSRRGRIAVTVALLSAGLLIPGFKASNTRVLQPPVLLPPVSTPRLASAAADTFPNVWLVEKTPSFETYSNGLRIDNQYAVSNQTRLFYPVYPSAAIDPKQPEWRTEPAGIVYHTTESDQARFEPEHNGDLKRIGQAVLTHVQQKRCYHFLIDRFGQVFRIVRESDMANHAGNSVWADDGTLYINLNASFLGIAFETQTQHGKEALSANPAQIHSARVLTEMLRGKYHIAQSNCVTHAQVSVNPANMLVGYHTDWAGNFPFSELGLSDNYLAPPASIYAFGFEYDPAFVQATGDRIWQGLAVAEDRMRRAAAARGLPVSQYRSVLRKKYKEILDVLKAMSDTRETSHAT